MNTAREIRNIWDEIGRMKTRTAGSSSGAVKTFLGLNDTPAAYAGAALQNVRVNAGANALEFAAGGSGDVVGPAGATDNALARFHLATGKIIQNSNAILDDAGLLLLAETANAKMTIGLTINQAANSDEIFSAKSSTIAHGMTTFAETDTYGFLGKINAANGGLEIVGFNDTGSTGVRLRGHGPVMNTTRSNAGIGIIQIYGSKISGTGETNVDAGSNILSVACFTGGALPTVFLVNNTGATWQSGTGWINEASNVNMTIGQTINQGANDDEIQAYKSSDVAHGCTDYAETDTFISMAKLSAANGGMALNGFSAGAVGVGIRGFFGADNTAKTVAGAAAVCVYGYKISGTGITNSSADQNIFAVRTQRGGATETVVIIDEDGDIYYNGTLVSYDDYDDALACRDAKNVLSNGMAPVLYNQEKLIKMGIISKGGFISNKRMTALMLGAISQLYEENKGFKKQIAALAA